MITIRQPFDLVTLNKYKSEQPRNATLDIFFGGYDWNGEYIYLTDDGKVHFCAPDDCASLKEWDCFDDFLTSEIHRIFSLFDDKGATLDESTPTIPIDY